MYNAALDLIDRNLRAGRGEKLAFIDDDGSYTYGELAVRVNRCANALLELGLRAGDRVILGLIDSIAFPTAFLGAIRAGIIPIPVNTMFSVADYAFVIEHSGASAAIVSWALYESYTQAAAEIDSPIRFVIANASDGAQSQFDALVQAAATSNDVAATTHESPCFWLYSSGSTGRPKGTVHRHASLVRSAESFGQEVLGLHAGDVVFSAAKLFFAYGLGNALTFPLAVGATSILLGGRPVPDTIVDISSSRSRPSFTEFRRSLARCSRANALRVRHRLPCASARPRASLFRNASAKIGAPRPESISSTASARRRCCTSSYRPGPVR